MAWVDPKNRLKTLFSGVSSSSRSFMGEGAKMQWPRDPLFWGPRALTLGYDFSPLLIPTNDKILNFSLRKDILGISGCYKSKIFPNHGGAGGGYASRRSKGPHHLIVALVIAHLKTATDEQWIWTHNLCMCSACAIHWWTDDLSARPCSLTFCVTWYHSSSSVALPTSFFSKGYLGQTSIQNVK